MNPDRTATEAECLENCIWVIGPDSKTKVSLLKRDREENAFPKADISYSMSIVCKFTYMAAAFGVDSTSLRQL